MQKADNETETGKMKSEKPIRLLAITHYNKGNRVVWSIEGLGGSLLHARLFK